MVNSSNPSKDCVTLRQFRSLTEAKLSSEHLAADNFYWRDFPTTSIPAEEHTNKSASLRSTFRWKPHWKIPSHMPTRADLRSGMKFTCRSMVARETLFPHAPPPTSASAVDKPIYQPPPPSLEKTFFFFTFSLRPLFLHFSIS